jgi:hypothetical protein
MPPAAGGTEELEMVRRSILVAICAASAALLPASAPAATAPAAPPILTSAPWAFPVTLHWTPANDPLNVSQSVYRATGPCTTPPAPGGLIATFPGNATSDFTGRPADGTYCYHVKVADLLSTADGPGVTVSVDTANPTATVAISGQSPAGVVSGTVGLSGTSADAVSGVASSVLHAGPAGACASGPVLAPAWNTTAVPNGTYDVCNVVTDNAGHSATATLTVTVSNAQPAAAPAAAAAAAAGAPAVRDTLAPPAPVKLTVALTRSKRSPGDARVTLRWVNPAAPDLDRVVAVLNRARAPLGPADGHVIYEGLRTSVALGLRAGQRGYVALFAYDHSGNVSVPASLPVSLARLIPLRPLTGSVVARTPLLRWKARRGTTYYNVQLFHRGRRVLVDWPSRASYRIPAGKLVPGTYVWYVWPAVQHKGASPTFGKLIGRATFTVRR